MIFESESPVLREFPLTSTPKASQRHNHKSPFLRKSFLNDSSDQSFMKSDSTYSEKASASFQEILSETDKENTNNLSHDKVVIDSLPVERFVEQHCRKHTMQYLFRCSIIFCNYKVWPFSLQEVLK